MHVTLYRGATNPTPLRADDFDTWPELADALEDLIAVEAPNKLELLAFGPHRLHADDRRTETERKGAPPAPGPYRHMTNVAAVTLMVIDVDRCNAEALAASLAEAEVDALMYASPSDNAEGDPNARRVRVVAPMTHLPGPFTDSNADACRRSRQAFAAALGLEPGQGVEGAIDAAKFFFIGRLAGTPPREVWRFEAGS